MANSGYLAHGKLVARVDTDEAQDFTVVTPTARVVDMGTEFVVAVNSTGVTDAYVHEGVIAVKGFLAGALPQRLTAGKALRVDHSGVRETPMAALAAFRKLANSRLASIVITTADGVCCREFVVTRFIGLVRRPSRLRSKRLGVVEQPSRSSNSSS